MKCTKEQERKHLHYIENRERIRAQQRQYYYEHHDELLTRQRIYSRRRDKELKIKALKYYGEGRTQCVVCSESRLACLSIDHINGGGGKQRKVIGHHIYWWLNKHNYPEGYQTLCMNCQWVKRDQRKEGN